MDVLFENKCPLTKEIFLEFSKATYRHTSRLYRTGAMILGLVFIIGAAASLLMEGIGFTPAFLATGVACMAFTYYKGYITQAEKSLKSYQVRYGAGAMMTVTFYEDSLTSALADSNSSLKYSHITKIVETPALIILLSGKKGIILKRGGFTAGGEEDFLSFIRDKTS